MPGRLTYKDNNRIGAYLVCGTCRCELGTVCAERNNFSNCLIFGHFFFNNVYVFEDKLTKYY